MRPPLFHFEIVIDDSILAVNPGIGIYSRQNTRQSLLRRWISPEHINRACRQRPLLTRRATRSVEINAQWDVRRPRRYVRTISLGSDMPVLAANELATNHISWLARTTWIYTWGPPCSVSSTNQGSYHHKKSRGNVTLETSIA